MVAAVLALVLAMIAKPVWDGREQWQFGQGQDDGMYMVAAKALASGEGYRQVNLPGHPYATKYPPMFLCTCRSRGGSRPIFRVR